MLRIEADFPAGTQPGDLAYGDLRASGDLVVSGPTRTNLLDLYLAVSA